MKASIEEIKEKGFKPFDYIIRLETKRELEFLYSLFLANQDEVLKLANKFKGKDIQKFTTENISFEVWDILNQKLSEYDIRKI